ncbi:MAG: hypothetical protein WCP22_12000 [Chlamydiota bacterium]
MRCVRDRTLLLLVALFILTRMALLLFGFHDLTQFEELYNGTVARELVRGPCLSLSQLRYVEYQSGSLIMSFLIIPFFALFGDTWFALKLVALLFSAATLTVFYLILRVNYSRAAAFWGGLLFVFPPRIFALLNLKAEGANSQAIFFTMAAWCLFLRYLRRTRGAATGGDGPERSTPGLGEAFVLGSLLSFGIWFCPVVVLATGCILLVWFAADKFFILTPGFLCALGGFSLGAVPAVMDYAQNNFAGMKYLSSKPIHGRTGSLVGNLAELWGPGLLHSFSFLRVGPVPGAALNWCWYLLAILSLSAFMALFWRHIFSFLCAAAALRTRRAASFESLRDASLLLSIAAFSASYAATKFHIEATSLPIHNYRYLVSLYPFLFMVIAVVAEGLHPRPRRFARGVLVTTVCVGALGIAASLSPVRFGEGLRLKGYSYEMLGLRMYENFRGDADRVFTLVQEKIPERDDREVCKMVYANLLVEEWLSACGDRAITPVLRRIGGVAEQWRRYFYCSLGATLYGRYQATEDLPAWQAHLMGVDELNLGFCYLGLGSIVNEIAPGDVETRRRFTERVPPRYRRAFLMGLRLKYRSI